MQIGQLVGANFEIESVDEFTLIMMASIFTSMYIILGSFLLEFSSNAAAFSDVRWILLCKFSANEFSQRILSKWKVICIGFRWMNNFDEGTVERNHFQVVRADAIDDSSNWMTDTHVEIRSPRESKST